MESKTMRKICICCLALTVFMSLFSLKGVINADDVEVLDKTKETDDKKIVADDKKEINEEVEISMKTLVTYPDSLQAEIEFDLTSVEEQFEVKKIISLTDNKSIYDINGSDKNLKYISTKNGDYQFSIEYIDKTKKEPVALEKNKIIIATVSDIKDIDTEADIENKTEDYVVEKTEDIVEKKKEKEAVIEGKANDALDRVTRADAPATYKQRIRLRGLVYDGAEEKLTLTINPQTYQITKKIGNAAYKYHPYFGLEVYYRITAYKKNAPLSGAGTVVFEALGSNDVGNEKINTITSFDFEEGDYIKIYCAERRFSFLDNPILASDGVSTLDYRNGVSDNYRNAVYKFTANGFQEIYNAAPTITGNNTVLFGVYGQANWSDGNIGSSALYYDMRFMDDCNELGAYAYGGYQITVRNGKMGYSVSGVPANNAAVGIYTATYNVTDSWGRAANPATRYLVQLPQIDSKIKIAEMSAKRVNGADVNGFVDLAGATVNGSQKRVTFGSGTFINVDSSKESLIEVPYANGTFAKITKTNTGALNKIQLPDSKELSNSEFRNIKINNDKSIEIEKTNDKEYQTGPIIKITSHGRVIYPYKQRIELHGQGISGLGSYKLTLTIDPQTYQITTEGVKYGYHYYFGTDVYYRIIAYKKNARLGDTGTVVYEALGSQGMGRENINTITNFNFEEGDYIKIYCPENRFHFVDNPILASDGVSMVDYRNGVTSKNNHAVYRITANGLQEIYNEAPTIIGTNISLFGVYGQAKWFTDWNLGGSALFYDIRFMDDRNELGAYVRGGYQITSNVGKMNYGVSGYPLNNTEVKISKATYNVTDSWGRAANPATRFLVQLPQIDSKIKIAEMKEKKVNGAVVGGFVDFAGASVNDSQKKVTLGSGVIMNIDTSKDALIEVPYMNGTTTKIITDTASKLKEVQISNSYKIDSSHIKAVEIDENKGVLIKTDKEVTLPETQVALGKQKVWEEISKQLSATGATDSISDIIYENPKEGSHEYKLCFGKVQEQIKVSITNNTWSYDSKDRTEENGASGFIVIPKRIVLKRTEPKKIGSTEEIFFANYEKARQVEYKLFVDKGFEMNKENATENHFHVVSSPLANVPPEEEENMLFVGNINNTNTKGSGVLVKFEATSDIVDKSKGLWTGNVTFHFDRK